MASQSLIRINKPIYVASGVSRQTIRILFQLTEAGANMVSGPLFKETIMGR